MFKPTFLLIATGRYNDYVKQCTDSIKKHVPGASIILFGDNNAEISIKHLPFPYVTLYRFHYFNQAKDTLKGDYFYFMDIDSEFVRKPEIKGDLVGTRHCAFYINYHELPQETNKASVFFNYTFKKYYGGGFFGGNRDEFFKLSRWCQDAIDIDLTNKIIPRHNDETALNAYFTIHPPTLELTPNYHYPENDDYFSRRCWNNTKPFNPVIKLLDKFKQESEVNYRQTT